MISSTSSSKIIRKELYVVASVLLVLLGLEIGLRFMGASVSDNLRKIEALPTQSQQLSLKEKPRFLILGNSYTIRGIEPNIFAEKSREFLGRELSHEFVLFHAAHLCEWYWLAERHFFDKSSPDYLVLNTGIRSLYDNQSVDHRRMARYFSVNSSPFLPMEDLQGFDTRMEFVLSKISLLFSRSIAIGRLVHERLIPDYKQGIKWTNKARAAQAEKQSAEPGKHTYQRLTRFLALVREANTTPVFFFMPSREKFEIPDDLRQIITENGGLVIDGQNGSGLLPDNFRDEVHLTPEGARKYTPVYTSLLAGAIPGLMP